MTNNNWEELFQAERERVKLTNKDWIQILKTAIESRPTSWVKNPVIEWRNAADELMLAHEQAINQPAKPSAEL